MSDTPRTDVACFAVVSNDPQSVVVWADFARQLERENAELREQIAALGEIACLNLDDATVAKCDAVTGGEKYRDVMHRLFVEQPKELAALRQDKGIIDWMNNNIQAIMFKYQPDDFTLDFREIIGDAMRKEAKP